MNMRKIICKWIPVMLSWWLILFPEIVFCSGMCIAYDGERAEQIQMDREALRELLFYAKPEQIEYKSFLWELLAEKEEHTKEW